MISARRLILFFKSTGEDTGAGIRSYKKQLLLRYEDVQLIK